MNDVERDLRELFDRKASSVGGVAPRLPDRVRKQGRRREVGTALVSGLTVLALVVGSVAVVRSLDVGGDDRTAVNDPWAGYEVFERTATIETITITSPSDWYLVNQWPIGAGTITSFSGSTESCEIDPDGKEQCETVTSSPNPVSVPEGLPVVQLSNIDLGLGKPRCGEDLVEGEAVLYVAIDENISSSGYASPAWPVPLEERASGPCGPGLYATFSAGETSYLAWAGLGEETTDDQRDEVLAAFERMQIGEGPVRPPRTAVPAYVIAGGENAAGPWRLELQPSPGNGPAANVELYLHGSEGQGSGTGSFTVPRVPIEAAGGDPVFGAVTREARGVELRLEPGTPPILAQIVPLPPSLPFGFDLFFGSNPGDVPARAVAVDGEGVAIDPTEPQVSPSTPPGSRVITAENIRFDRERIEIPSGGATIEFRNADAGIAHSLAGYTDTGQLLFASKVIMGPDVETIDVDPWVPGTYSFRCRVHPTQMMGTLVMTSNDTSETVVERGDGWRLVYEPEGAADGSLWFEEPGRPRFAPLPVSAPDGRSIGGWQVSGVDGQLILFGFAGEDVERLSFTSDDGQAVDVAPMDLPIDGARAFAIVYTGTMEGEGFLVPGGRLVARDENGAELAARRISN